MKWDYILEQYLLGNVSTAKKALGNQTKKEIFKIILEALETMPANDPSLKKLLSLLARD